MGTGSIPIVLIILILLVIGWYRTLPEPPPEENLSEILIETPSPTLRPTPFFEHKILTLVLSDVRVEGYKIYNTSRSSNPHCPSSCLSFLSDDNLDLYDMRNKFNLDSTAPLWFRDHFIAHNWQEFFREPFPRLGLAEPFWTFSSNQGKKESGCDAKTERGTVGDMFLDKGKDFGCDLPFYFLCLCTDLLIS